VTSVVPLWRGAEAAPAGSAPGGDVVARLDGVTFAYAAEGLPAVDSVSIDIERGEFVTLVGPSGCGKSTILRLLASLSSPTSGEIGFGADVDWSGGNAVGVVFQDATLLPWRNALDNVGLPLELQGVSRRVRRQRALEALSLVGLTSHVSSLPRQLSGGMRMRVAIARALVNEPSLLLMDEPFGALDAITREALQVELLRIWDARRCTIVFVTHSVSEAVFLSSRIVVMTPHPGRVAQTVTVEIPYPRGPEIRTAPAFAASEELVYAALNDGEGS
jgi:NitT/TauT family transport system ATP-binding protein